MLTREGRIARRSRVAGSLIGAALGDAMGRPTEFMTMAQINDMSDDASWGARAALPLPKPAVVTDDTMMMVAVARALIDTGADMRIDGKRGGEAHAADLRQWYIEWLAEPQEGRAPGPPCISAVRKMRDGRPWPLATDLNSKGCGANMRVQPYGLAKLPLDTMAGMAQLSAAMTHGHPTALAAADLTAYAIRQAAMGAPIVELIQCLIGRCERERTVYRETWLGNLYWGYAQHPRHIIAQGWDECAAALRKVLAAPSWVGHVVDPCKYTGDGWVAEEALATALYCALLTDTHPVRAIQRAAATGGDSDSIACIAGSIVGAMHGLKAWPTEWVARVEFSDDLLYLAAMLA